MANQDKQSTPARRISDDERFHYIGFEVCPGKPKDLFRNDAEKADLVRKVEAKRAKGDLLRDDCKLLEERVSTKERWFLTVASFVIVLSLFLPWYSAYKEIASESSQPVVSSQAAEGGAEVITSARVQKKVQRDYETLTGIGGLIAIGSAGGKMFSSGFILILTAIIMLAYTLLCLWLPFRALTGLWKSKKTGDELALHLKYLLRLNWLPIILIVVAFVFSFFGADYGFAASSTFTSLGSSYGPGVFLGTATWGLLVSMAGFIVLATKGIEI